MSLIESSSRVAFAALIHDLGKFAQRAQIAVSKQDLQIHQQLFCPVNPQTQAPSHIHSAYTSLAVTQLEPYWPSLTHGDVSPFEGSKTLTQRTDSLVNAAAMHHRPQTSLQWCVAMADRVASGFEREQLREAEGMDPQGPKAYITTRMWSLFEQIQLDADRHQAMVHRLPVKALSVDAIYPEKVDVQAKPSVQEATQTYSALWQQFVDCQKRLPESFKASWSLWLDTFDSMYLSMTHSIASATAFNVKPDVSLYDHSKSTAAIATALWRWVHAKSLSEQEKVKLFESKEIMGLDTLLLIQGDFFGIQNFIFPPGASTDKKMAKVLRGRSFYVSLLTELYALKLLQVLELPSTSQIMNAAGKFLIVAPDTEEIRQKLQEADRQMQTWFMDKTCGQCQIGYAYTPATLQDFMCKNFHNLQKRIYRNLEVLKRQRLGLFEQEATSPILEKNFPYGVCAWHGQWPADQIDDAQMASCAISRDEIKIGQAIVSTNLMVVLPAHVQVPQRRSVIALELPIFGYRVYFMRKTAFKDWSRDLDVNDIVRVWDYALPESDNEVFWQDYARRPINGYVPRQAQADTEEPLTIHQILAQNNVLTFEQISQADQGLKTLCFVKGDVDSLGRIFQEGLVDRVMKQETTERTMTFAKMCGLSRQLNFFFSTVVPLKCATTFKNMYTVFSGGDDFFFIGPREESLDFVSWLHKDFQRFVAGNPEVHFSAGLSVLKPGMPIRYGNAQSEHALSEAKQAGRNRLSLYGITVDWPQWHSFRQWETDLEQDYTSWGIPNGFTYKLLDSFEKAQLAQQVPQAAIWRSQLYYRAARLAQNLQPLHANAFMASIQPLVSMIEQHKGCMRLPLTNLMYRYRGEMGE